jgi:cytoskeletal protein CcmA (bactofilin family)
MEAGGTGSVRISGSGTAGGGVYDEIAISGSGKVTGDAEARNVRVSGAAHFEGSVKADSLRGSGSFHVARDVEAGEFKCSGSAHVGGSVKADKLAASGSVKIGGNAKVVNAHISGSTRIGGDLEGEHVRSSGVINVGGLLSADTVEMALGGNCRVREIGGERITVLCGGRIGRGFFCFGWLCRTGSLTVESIEGDDVHLEATTAKIVRGQRVKIGRGCRIERVEYGESLQIDPDARVDETGFTGEGEPSPVDRSPVQQPEGGLVGNHGWNVNIAEIRNPIVRGLALILGLGVAAAAVAFAMLVTGVTVGLTLGGVVLLLVILAGGVPLLIVGALILSILLIPIRAIAALFGRRRPW